ncbi:hypothetical protein BDW59DRAFT_152871 [Aspergillus cavernicola]|uniref:CHAD domain-containing protein n=1 Tax=Aspergillus cavernicola TaxID=176166 RepID=A0ABR4HNT5_9EURO
MSLYKELKKAYKIISYARKDIKLVKDRTKKLKRLWCFFDETMKKVSKIDEFSVDLKRYSKINKALVRQSHRVIRKIQSILSIFHPILAKKPTSAWKNFRIRLEWLFRDREELRLLYVDIDFLTGYMNVFVSLVQTQIAVQQYTLTGSAATKFQIDTFQNRIDAALKEIRQVQKDQGFLLSVKNDPWQKEIRHEVRRILGEEVSQTKKADSGNDSSSGSSPRLSPPAPPPSTPPTTPSSQSYSSSKGTSIIELLTKQEESLPEPTSSRNIQPNTHVTFNPESEPSYVSVNEVASSKQSGVALDSPRQAADELEDGETESDGEGGGMYMPTALFGPPKPQRRRPRARVSNQ